MRTLSAKFNGPVWLIVAHGSHALFQWILIVILGRLFGMADLGLYTSTMAVLTPIVLVTGLNSRGVQLADVGDRWKLSETFATRVAGMGLALVGVGVYATAVVGVEGVLIWLVLFCRVAAEAIAEPIHAGLIASRRFKTFAVTYLIRSAVSVGAFAILALIGAPLVACLAVWAGVWIAILMLRDMQYGGFVSWAALLPVDVAKMRSFARASVPLAVVGVVNSLYVSIPILFLKRHYGLEVVGVYSAMAYVNMAIGLFVGAVTMSSARATALAYSRGLHGLAKKRVHRQLLFVAACGLPTFIVMLLFGESLIELLYQIDGTGYGAVIMVQLAAVVLQAVASVFGVAATAAGRNVAQVVIAAGCVLVQFVLCLLLVPGMGALGAALSGLVIFGIKGICLYAVLPRLRLAGCER